VHTLNLDIVLGLRIDLPLPSATRPPPAHTESRILRPRYRHAFWWRLPAASPWPGPVDDLGTGRPARWFLPDRRGTALVSAVAPDGQAPVSSVNRLKEKKKSGC